MLTSSLLTSFTFAILIAELPFLCNSFSQTSCNHNQHIIQNTAITCTVSRSPLHRQPYPNQRSNRYKFMPLRATTTSSTTEEDEEKKQRQREEDELREKAFWTSQRAILKESSKTVQKEEIEKYNAKINNLVADTLYLSVIIFCTLWIVSDNPLTALSYEFGGLLGTFYSYGLGKYVQSLGGSPDDEEIQGAGVGQARFAFLIILFIIIGKFRSQGLQEIPSIAGFFTYQIASLIQALREDND